MSKTIEITEELAASIDGWLKSCGPLAEGARAKLLAAPVVERQPVAEISNKYGDPYTFAERELRPLVDIQKLPLNTMLYTSPPAPVAVVLPPDPEKAFLEWSSTLPSPPRCMQSYFAALEKVKELNQ